MKAFSPLWEQGRVIILGSINDHASRNDDGSRIGTKILDRLVSSFVGNLDDFTLVNQHESTRTPVDDEILGHCFPLVYTYIYVTQNLSAMLSFSPDRINQSRWHHHCYMQLLCQKIRRKT